MIPFTKRKFNQLEEKQRHKKCAELVRDWYVALQKKVPFDRIEEYQTYLAWMHLPLPKTISLKTIADLYHNHLRAAHKSLKEHNLLPHIRKGDHVAKRGFLPIAIYLDNLRSAYNVGSILRTMEALRIGSLYCGKNTPDISNEKVEHTSMGASHLVPCYSGVVLANLPRPWIALETSDDAVPVAEFVFPEEFTLILGNEEYGVSDEVLQEVDALIEIPLVGIKNSINVACAFSIAAAEIARQYIHK